MRDFVEKAMRTNKPLVHEMALMHAALGLAGEAGEFADCIKKFTIYGKALDVENAKEELGDILWYVALAMQELHLDPQEVMDGCIAKLAKRYPEKYTDALASARLDKQEAPKTQKFEGILHEGKWVEVIAQEGESVVQAYERVTGELRNPIQEGGGSDGSAS